MLVIVYFHHWPYGTFSLQENELIINSNGVAYETECQFSWRDFQISFLPKQVYLMQLSECNFSPFKNLATIHPHMTPLELCQF